MATDDDDDLDWDEIYREKRRDLLRWAGQLRAAFERAVDEAGETLFPPPKKLEDLLATFELEDAHRQRTAVANWNADADRAAAHAAAVKEKDDINEVRALAPPPENAEETVAHAGLEAASNVLDKVAKATDTIDPAAHGPAGAVHVSDTAKVFKNWHLTDIPETYVAPYFELVGDPEIVDNIKKARSMLEEIPHGQKGVKKRQPAGTMAWTVYDPKKTEGWMYVEPFNGEYGKWCQEQVKQRYAAAKAKADEVAADPSATASKKMGARAAMRIVSAAYATMRQEGFPSAINTYDGTILTWCSGLAAQGKLKSVFYAINKDPNIRKAMYLCGFLFEGTPLDGTYQIVDIQKISTTYYRTNFASQDARDPNDPNKIKYVAGTRDYADYKVLQKLVDQIELLYMLIMVARDPLTRQTVFDVNFTIVERMVGVGSAELIATEALYVFIGEVKHNWAITENMVEWARKKLTPAEAAPPCPSEEYDRALAKGVFRYVLRRVQRDAWSAAVGRLKVMVKKAGKKMLAEGLDFHNDVMAKVVYSFDRLVDNYWKPMQTGIGPQRFKPHMIDESTLAVPDFPPLASAATPNVDDVIVYSPNAKASYNLGSNAQCDFIFTNTSVKLMGFDESGNVIVQAQGAAGPRWTLTPKGEKVP